MLWEVLVGKFLLEDFGLVYGSGIICRWAQMLSLCDRYGAGGFKYAILNGSDRFSIEE